MSFIKQTTAVTFFLSSALLNIGFATSVEAVMASPGTCTGSASEILARRGITVPKDTIITEKDLATFGVTCNGADPIAFLQERNKVGANLTGLNPQFAQCLAALIQKAEAQNGGKKVQFSAKISAYRPGWMQTQLVKDGASKAGPGKSKHNCGLAADIDGAVKIMQQLGPEFGIHNPPQLRGWDDHHFQAQNAPGYCTGSIADFKMQNNQNCGAFNTPENMNPDPNWGGTPDERNKLTAQATAEERLQQLAYEAQQTEAQNSAGGSSAGSTPGSSTLSPNLDPVFADPQKQEQVNSLDKSLLECVKDFGSSTTAEGTNNDCQEQYAKQLQQLLEDTSPSTDPQNNSTLPDKDANQSTDCTQAGTSISLNSASCIQAGPADKNAQANVPVKTGLGGQSVNEVIPDTRTLSQRVVQAVLGPVSADVSSNAFDWFSSKNSAPQYMSFEYYQGKDAIYLDENGIYRYKNTHQPVPQGLVDFVLSDNTQQTQARGISLGTLWTVGSALTRAVLQSSFGLPIPHLFSF